MATTTRSVRCRTVRGALLAVELTDRAEFVTPGSVLEQRLVVAANQQVFVRKWVSRTRGAREPWRYDLLDNEIRAGTRLGQVLGDRYPPELARLAAYNMDAEEPFVLLHQYLGEPALDVADRLDDTERRNFQVGLLRALQTTAAAGVVHGAVTLAALRWDGRTVQLVDFDLAERAGEPRRRRTSPRTAARSPEQLAGTGPVDVRDDLWGAGQLIRTLYLGGTVNGWPPGQGGEPERLRAVLDPIFGNPAEQRPYPADLLRMLRAENRTVPAHDPDDSLTAGRDRFDRHCATKRRPTATRSPADPAPRPGTRVLLPLLATILVVAVVVIGMAVLA